MLSDILLTMPKKSHKNEVCIEGDHNFFIASTGNIFIHCRFVY